MPIAYEEVDNLVRLPFKFFKRSNYAPKAPTHWHTGIEIDYLVSGEDFKVVIAGQTHHYNSGDIWAIDRSQIHAATGHKDRSYYVMGLIIDNNFFANCKNKLNTYHNIW
ncbi:cupin domain-containing protein [Lactobacillus delbrueckii]|uniref:cupin domain-containing protein n=1 Tax=Lactobacillus delbrueckii TaxID=1584 RepID=UPI001E2C2DC9|nr:cupin domain-containing protein [Lactobacillus delbrueckii]MCD5440914.1 cupin domain-containing protein [Lactobacillus delbrueckii subsp. lactis]MCD5484913.1 cupin domain-containing protein [Lactobacillus delbrueckii subsp. lactis]